MMKDHLDYIQAMTEENLKDFMSCPYKFYYEYIEKKKRPLDWRQMVQHVVNQVVSSFYQLPKEQQHTGSVLRLIDKYWSRVPLQLFESRIQYYLVAAKITDHLMQHLQAGTEPEPPLFLYEKFKTHIQELKADISLTFDVAEWSSSSFVVKKYLVEANPDMLRLYYLLSIVFSEKVFQKIPSRIEVVTLLDGKKHVYIPTEATLEEGINYLQILQKLLAETSGFHSLHKEEECPSCPFQHVCDRNGQKLNQPTYLS